jgi:hypothetical protein
MVREKNFKEFVKKKKIPARTFADMIDSKSCAVFSS